MNSYRFYTTSTPGNGSDPSPESPTTITLPVKYDSHYEAGTIAADVVVQICVSKADIMPHLPADTIHTDPDGTTYIKFASTGYKLPIQTTIKGSDIAITLYADPDDSNIVENGELKLWTDQITLTTDPIPPSTTNYITFTLPG